MEENNKETVEVEAEKIEVVDENKDSKEPSKEEGRGISIASLVLGIVCLITDYGRIICAILAIVFGVIGMKKDGNKMAKAGLIMGIIGLAFWILLLVGAASLIGFGITSGLMSGLY